MFDNVYKMTYNVFMYTTNELEGAYHDGVQAERERILELIEVWLADDGMNFDDIFPEILNG